MERLVDYFAVVGYDVEKEHLDPTLRGKICVRIPETDWNDARFTSGIELFCQPAGWYMSKEKNPPTFFVSVLTNEEGKQQFCAVHTFSEPIRSNSPSRILRKEQVDNTSTYKNFCTDSDTSGNVLSNSELSHGDDYIDEEMFRVENDHKSKEFNLEDSKTEFKYAPKCLVLLSKVQDFRILKNCLGLIYTVYIENLTVSIENIIAKLLLIKVPPPGSTQVRFSICSSDKQALQIPQNSNLPITRSSVTVLLKQLGILNVLNILCAALVDQKLLFYSCSYVRLTEACNALTALMYPFKYSYPYIPILPRHLLECTSSPTPFLIGVHSSFKYDLTDLLDVITVDLDGGVISIPECVILPVIPEPYYTSIVESLTKVLCPDLIVADWAYPPEQTHSHDPERLDKEIRAIFLRLFSELLMGYRTCLQVCRIHPEPIIRFKKEQYLTMRSFDVSNTRSSNEFVPKLLDSQAFSLFVQENGPPYRRLHMFDEVVADLSSRINSDVNNLNEFLKYNKKIASDLYINENPNHMALAERIPKPSSESYERTTQRRFPKLSATAVLAFMEENRVTAERERHVKHPTPSRKRVPEGNRTDWSPPPSASSRRLEVLRSCLLFIFEGRTLEIKKIFQAVIRAMKSRAIRRALVQELLSYSTRQSTLDNQQFDYVSRLVNTALQDSSGQPDEFLLAADLLPITTCFIRKLSRTVTQFLYSTTQEQSVWWSSAFWEAAFFEDVQGQIMELYKTSLKVGSADQHSQVFGDQKRKQERESSPTSFTLHQDGRRNNQECMGIAASELQRWGGRSEEERAETSRAEEAVVYSQVKHYVQRMLCMLVPFDSSCASRLASLRYTQTEENSNSYITGSWHDSQNGSVEDVSRESDADIRSSLSNFIGKFVDRVCTEACINNDLTKQLVAKIPTMVDMQMDSLEDVVRESSRLPPVMKPKLLQPRLLAGEFFALQRPLRVFLAFDGRATATGGEIGGPAFLPAEGALFLTSYRVIFIGAPCDALASEQVVIRAFPVSSLFKDKSFKVGDFPHVSSIEGNMQNGIRLHSATFQMLVLAFDEEISSQEQENFFKQLELLRYPSTIQDCFALSSSSSVKKSLGSTKDSSTTRISAAKVIYKQAKRKAGLNKSGRFSRIIPSDAKTVNHAPNTPVHSSSGRSRIPILDTSMGRTLSDKNTMKLLAERSSEADYKRVGLLSTEGAKFRLSTVNRLFSVCRSYPTCVVVPFTVTDDQIKSLAHCHQQNKFPASVWIHPDKKSVLFRSGSIRSRTGNSLFKHGQQKLSDEGLVGSSLEEEKFLNKVASLVPPIHSPPPLLRLGSTSSLSSCGDETSLSSPATPRGSMISLNNPSRFAPDPRRWSTLTRSNGKAPDLSAPRVASRSTAAGALAQVAMKNAISRQARLCVLVTREQFKSLRNDPQGLVSFLPLNLADPKQIRSSFKSLLKSCLPVAPPTAPSTGSSPNQLQDTMSTYLKDVEDSLWLDQVSKLLLAAGVVVDIMDSYGASVMISMDDSSDLVPQLSSLSQILMDPHYRTISGFRTLIEKDWLSFGHRFSHRNRFSNFESSGFTPVFLMFLDAVYQIHRQLPMSFEFNELLLETIAYHYTSNRFTTFLLDSDFDRLDAGILFEHRSDPGGASSPIKSLWEYIDASHSRAPVFFNPLYCPAYLPSQVLRPIHLVSRLRVWPYYYRESLSEGPPYDGLLGELGTGSGQNEHEATEVIEGWGGATGRRVVNCCYDNIEEAQPNSIKALMGKVEALQRELKLPVDDWNTSWRSINADLLRQRVMPNWLAAVRDELQSLRRLSTASMIGKRPPRVRSDASETTSVTSGEDIPSPTTFEVPNFPSSSPVFRTSIVEVRTFEGSLWKQGAFMRSWKLKYFVLDSTKHELRQYDNKHDISSKNIIDLKDLEAVQRIESVSNPPKEARRDAYFEVRVSKRTYHFISDSGGAADQWVDNLQTTLQ